MAAKATAHRAPKVKAMNSKGGIASSVPSPSASRMLDEYVHIYKNMGKNNVCACVGVFYEVKD